MLCAWQAAQNHQELCVLQIQALFWGHLPPAACLYRLMHKQLMHCPSRSAASNAKHDHAFGFACRRFYFAGGVLHLPSAKLGLIKL
jgi:hypothetical protein